MKNGPFDFFDDPNRGQGEEEGSFDQFEATELYCIKCGRAVPVHKSLLLILPDGEKYEYRCQFCGSTVGDKMDKGKPFPGLIRP